MTGDAVRPARRLVAGCARPSSRSALTLARAAARPTSSVALAAAPGRRRRYRLVIWRDTMPIIRDFWLTGTGAGTYETVDAGLPARRRPAVLLQPGAQSLPAGGGRRAGCCWACRSSVALALFVRDAWRRARRRRVGHVLDSRRRVLRPRRRRGAEHLGDRPDDAGQRRARRVLAAAIVVHRHDAAGAAD